MLQEISCFCLCFKDMGGGGKKGSMPNFYFLFKYVRVLIEHIHVLLPGELYRPRLASIIYWLSFPTSYFCKNKIQYSLINLNLYHFCMYSCNVNLIQISPIFPLITQESIILCVYQKYIIVYKMYIHVEMYKIILSRGSREHHLAANSLIIYNVPLPMSNCQRQYCFHLLLFCLKWR